MTISPLPQYLSYTDSHSFCVSTCVSLPAYLSHPFTLTPVPKKGHLTYHSSTFLDGISPVIESVSAGAGTRQKSHPCASVPPAQYARQAAAVADQWDVDYMRLPIPEVC